MTSIFVVIAEKSSTTNVMVLNRYVFTIWIIFSADVAELMAASASHMVTALVLLDPELASFATLCT